MRQLFLAVILCHATKKLGNLNVRYNKAKSPVELKTNVKFLQDLLSGATKTSGGKVVLILECEYVT